MGALALTGAAGIGGPMLPVVIEWVRRKRHRRGALSERFDLEAPGSRFTMRLGFAVQVDHKWADRAETERSGVARIVIEHEFGNQWIERDPALGDTKVVDGSHGRGASGWIPVLEWVGLSASQGLVGLAVAEAARESIRRIRSRIEQTKSTDHRVLVSRGLAAALAMEYIFETTDETQVLHVEFAQEPSVLGGRPPTETSYTGLEPWIVVLVNGSRRNRYVVVVSAEGAIEGCISVPATDFEAMFGLLPPAE